MSDHDTVYNFRDKEPEKDFWWIFDDGLYYWGEYKVYWMYTALYGNPGKNAFWSYTCFDADDTVGGPKGD